jgi:hypothetical protein
VETITVAIVEHPAAGRKQGTVHDTKGNRWKVWADKIPNYALGSTYEVNYKTNHFNGQTFNVIETAKKIAGATPQEATAAAATYNASDEKRSEQIAVLAIVKEWVPQITVGDTAGLVHAIRVVREAWKQAYAKPLPSKIESGPHPVAEFNDEIPGFEGHDSHG